MSFSLATSKVPATACARIRHGALVEAGDWDNVNKFDKGPNAMRDAFRAVRRWGIGWRVPIDKFNFQCEDGSWICIGYLHPKNMLEYLISKHPITLLGVPDLEVGKSHCYAFWKSYRDFHGTHEVFNHFASEAQLSHIIPVALHGDEGRGKRRSNTTVASWEAVLGHKGHLSECGDCVPTHLDPIPHADGQNLLAHKLKSNMKGHSFIQHFVSFILPGVLLAGVSGLLDAMLAMLADEFAKLFRDGAVVCGTKWRIGVVGCKGDLKWHSKVCHLIRGYENKSPTLDAACCHLCHAGLPGLPAEDLSEQPAWLRTLYTTRPWHPAAPPAVHRIPFDSARPEFMYKTDGFHTLRLGLFRDFIGSTIFLLIRWGFFLGQGDVPTKLNAAFGHFRLWLRNEGKTASLRSFTKAFFSYSNRQSFPWVNAKGSDVTLLLKWLAVTAVAAINRIEDPHRLEPLQVILSVARLAIDWFDLINSHGLWLRPSCGAVLYEKGRALVCGYGWLANYAFQHQECLYALKPKLHFQMHALMELRAQLDGRHQAILSPVIWDCQQNEDCIGRVSKLSRILDSRVVTTRVLESYLVKAGILLQRSQRQGA